MSDLPVGVNAEISIEPETPLTPYDQISHATAQALKNGDSAQLNDTLWKLFEELVPIDFLRSYKDNERDKAIVQKQIDKYLEGVRQFDKEKRQGSYSSDEFYLDGPSRLILMTTPKGNGELEFGVTLSSVSGDAMKRKWNELNPDHKVEILRRSY